MADVRVIGAVAVKVRPDTDGFRDRTKREVLNQLRNFEADIDIHANIDERELDREVQSAKKRVEKKMTLAWHTDYDSIDKAVKQVERKLKDLSAMTLDVEINKDDLGAAEDLLKDLRTGARIKMEVASDERGFKEVLGKIEAIRRERLLKTVQFETDEDSLNKMAGEYTAKLNELAQGRTVEIDIMPDRAGFTSAIALIDKELAKFNTRKFSVEVDEDALRDERAKLEQMLTAEPYEMKVDWGNTQSLEAAKRELEQKLAGARAVSLLVDPDEQSIQDAIDQINQAIRDAEANKVDLETVAHTASSAAQLAFVARGRFSDIYVRVNKRSLALAEGLLQSLSGVNTLRSLGRSLENLATNFDTVAIKAAGTGAVLGGVINTLSYAGTAMLAIGEGVFQSVGLLAAAPAMLAALTASIVITKAAFEDFGAAVDGDNEALAALPANAQAAANALRGAWEMIQQPTQNAFWEGMGSSMADVVEVIMPQFRDGLSKSAVHAGRFTAGVMNSFKKLALSGDLNTMFDNLSGMFDKAAGAAEPLFDAINRLGLRGSEYLPRFGQWLTDIATRFDNWIKISDDSGAINRWIEDGIASLKDMWGVAGSTVDIFKALTRAANTAGQMGLGRFNDNLRATADMMLGEPFQSRLSTIFQGANKGASELNVGVKALGRSFGESAGFVAEMLTKLGTLGGGLLSGIAKGFESIGFQSGIVDAIDGMNAAVETLAPSFRRIADVVGEFGSIAGAVFRGIAPVIATVVRTLDEGMARLGPSLQRIAGPLTGALTGVAQVLSGPVLFAVNAIAAGLDLFSGAAAPIQAVVLALGALAVLRMTGFISSFTTGLGRMNTAFAGTRPVISTWQATMARSIAMANRSLASMNPTPIGRAMTAMGGYLTSGRTMMQGFQQGIANQFVRVNTALASMNPGPMQRTMTTVVGIAARGALGVQRAFSGITSALGGPWGIAIAVGIGALMAYGKAQADAKAHVDALTDSLDKQTGAATADSVKLVADAFAKDSLNYFEWAGGAKEMGEAALDLGTTLTELAEIVAGSPEEYDEYIALLRRFPTDTTEGSEALKAWAAEMEISEAAARSLGKGGANSVITGLEAQRKALEESGHDFEQYGGAIESLEPKLSALGENMQVLADHSGDANDRVRALKDSLDILNGVAPNSEEALRKVNESMLGIGGVFVDAEGAVRDFSAAIDGTGKIDTSSAGGQSLYDDVTKLSEEWLALATGMAAEGASPEAIAGKLAGLQTEFANAGVAAGLSAEQVEAAFQRYMNGTPEQISMLLTLDDSLFNEKKELTAEGIRYMDSLQAIADIGGDDTNLRAALTTSYTNLEAFDAAVATATVGLDPTAADAVRDRILIDLINLAATDPTVAANMDPRLFDAEIIRVNEQIRVLDEADASPLVDIETAEARQRLAEVKALQDSVNKDTTSTHTQTLRLNDERPSTGRALDGYQPVAANGALVDSRARPLVRGLGAKMQKFANGGIAETPGRAKIYTPASTYRIFAEKETGGESYIPLAASKRTRSLAIWRETGKLLGAQEFANGGVSGAGGSSSGQPININVQAAPGMSEQTIVNVAMNALNYQLRNA